MATPLFATSPSGLMMRRNKKNLSLCLLPNKSSCLEIIPKQTATQLTQAPQSKPKPEPEPELESQLTNPYKNGPALILPNLYLGSEHNAPNLDQLNSLSIKYIINAAAEVNNSNSHLFQPFDNLLATPDPSSPYFPKKANRTTKESPLLYTPSTDTISSPPLSPSSVSSIGYKKLQWTHNQENITSELNNLIGSIDQARSRGQAVLVHCQCGVARSATIIIAYVMKMMNLSMDKAYTHVKSRAPAISPNMHLIYQLQKYERSLSNSPIHQNNTPPLLLQHQRFGFHQTSSSLAL